MRCVSRATRLRRHSRIRRQMNRRRILLTGSLPPKTPTGPPHRLRRSSGPVTALHVPCGPPWPPMGGALAFRGPASRCLLGPLAVCGALSNRPPGGLPARGCGGVAALPGAQAVGCCAALAPCPRLPCAARRSGAAAPPSVAACGRQLGPGGPCGCRAAAGPLRGCPVHRACLAAPSLRGCSGLPAAPSALGFAIAPLGPPLPPSRCGGCCGPCRGLAFAPPTPGARATGRAPLSPAFTAFAARRPRRVGLGASGSLRRSGGPAGRVGKAVTSFPGLRRGACAPYSCEPLRSHI